MVPDAPLPSQYGYDTYGAFNCSGPQMPVHDDARLAIDFIKRSHAAGKPFLVNLWIHEPHTPHYPRPEYLKQFAHLGDEAKEIYAAVLAHADARIGKVLTELERLDLTDNTLVIFSSDNGPEITGPVTRRSVDDESTGPGLGSFASVGVTGGHRGRKRSLLQGGIGVPFIARWPGRIAAGKIDDTTPITAVELFRFPDDRFERTNLRDEHSDEVRRLSALIDTWKETLPEEPNESCFSEKRDKWTGLSQTKKERR